MDGRHIISRQRDFYIDGRNAFVDKYIYSFEAAGEGAGYLLPRITRFEALFQTRPDGHNDGRTSDMTMISSHSYSYSSCYHSGSGLSSCEGYKD